MVRRALVDEEVDRGVAERAVHAGAGGAAEER
jgi:hypothetical protein